MFRVVRFAALGMLILAVTGCDPNKVIGKYFADLGLTRVAALRDDIEPGGLLVVDKSKALYADNMLDYVDESTPANFSVEIQNGIAEYNAVIKKHNEDRLINPSVALSVVENVAPVSFDGSIKLDSKVKIDVSDIRVRRLKVPTIKTFLGSPKSNSFRLAVLEFQAEKEGIQTYLIYEVWKAKKLVISSEKDQEVTASLKVGEVADLVSKAEGKFHLKRTKKDALEIESDRYYVFAVRSGELSKGTQKNAVTLRLTNFKKKLDGVMAAGGDEEYSAAPTGDFTVPLVLEREGQPY